MNMSSTIIVAGAVAAYPLWLLFWLVLRKARPARVVAILGVFIAGCCGLIALVFWSYLAENRRFQQQREAWIARAVADTGAGPTQDQAAAWLRQNGFACIERSPGFSFKRSRSCFCVQGNKNLTENVRPRNARHITLSFTWEDQPVGKYLGVESEHVWPGFARGAREALPPKMPLAAP